jgi:chemotaxis protein MotB
MAGHGGGAWKVAYADFVTAMMAFFMVMWIVAQSKPVKQAIAQYFNDPWKLSSTTGTSALG